MSDETAVADKPTENAVGEALFAYDHDAEEGVGQTQDTQQHTEQADTESQTPQDSPEDVETEQVEAEGSEATEVEQADSPQEEKSPKEDPEAFQYWQSHAQKYEGKLGVKPDEISDEEAQVFKVFRDHPEYLQKFAEFISGGGQQQQAQQADSQPEEGPKTLQRPEKPEKPVGYDPYEALNDPESDSYKYRIAKEQYLEDLAEFAEKKADSTREELTEKEKQRQAQAEAQRVKAQWYNHLTQNEGLTDEQFNDFWQWRQKDQFDPQEIVTMYKAARGIGGTKENNPEKPPKDQQKKQQSKPKSPPSPATTSGSGSQRQTTSKQGEDDQLFGYFDN